MTKKIQVGDLMGMPADRFVHLPSNKWILSRCKIGIEIEMEGLKTNHDTSLKKICEGFWTIHQDESLRNVDGKSYAELVSVNGLYGADLWRALDILRENEDKINPYFSHRTSVHIHIDIRNLSLHELVNFILLYTLCEDVLYEYASPDRKRNLFCLAFTEAEGWFLNHMIYILAQRSFKDNQNKNDRFDRSWLVGNSAETIEELQVQLENKLRNQLLEANNNDMRYLGCNLASIPKHGTLEFRHMGGTMDVMKIAAWINMIMSLKRAAKKLVLTEEVITNLVLPPNYKKLLKDIFVYVHPPMQNLNMEKVNDQVKLALEIYNKLIFVFLTNLHTNIKGHPKETLFTHKLKLLPPPVTEAKKPKSTKKKAHLTYDELAPIPTTPQLVPMPATPPLPEDDQTF